MESRLRAGSSVNRQPGPSIGMPDPWIGRRSSLNAYRYARPGVGERLALAGSQPGREVGASELCTTVSWSSVANAESRVDRLSLLGSPERRGQTSGSWGSIYAGSAHNDPQLLPSMPAFTTRQSRFGIGMRRAETAAGSQHLDDGRHRLAPGRPATSEQPGFRGGKIRPGSRQRSAFPTRRSSSRADSDAVGSPPAAGAAWRPTEYRSFFVANVEPPSKVQWPIEERQCGGRGVSRSMGSSRSLERGVGAGTTAFQKHLASRRRASLHAASSSDAGSERAELTGW